MIVIVNYYYYFLYNIKLVQLAGKSSLTPEHVFEHFEQNILPQIRLRQLNQKKKTVQPADNVGDAMILFCKAATKSEV